WHPWESGTDNAPSWDAALRRIAVPEGERDFRRVDVEEGDPQGRPSDEEYDRYAYLVRCFRDAAYDPATVRRETPFALRSVLFNALLVQADRDLGAIAGRLGRDPAPYAARAEALARALDDALWHGEHCRWVDHDVLLGAAVPTRSAAGFAPLFAGVPSPERA